MALASEYWRPYLGRKCPLRDTLSCHCLFRHGLSAPPAQKIYRLVSSLELVVHGLLMHGRVSGVL